MEILLNNFICVNEKSIFSCISQIDRIVLTEPSLNEKMFFQQKRRFEKQRDSRSLFRSRSIAGWRVGTFLFHFDHFHFPWSHVTWCPQKQSALCKFACGPQRTRSSYKLVYQCLPCRQIGRYSFTKWFWVNFLPIFRKLWIFRRKFEFQHILVSQHSLALLNFFFF